MNVSDSVYIRHLKYISLHCILGGAMEQRVERWTCDQQVVGSNPTRGKAA